MSILILRFFHSNERGGKNRQINDFAPPAQGKISENSTSQLFDIAFFNFHHISCFFLIYFVDTVCL
jgi:hypothetical protein